MILFLAVIIVSISIFYFLGNSQNVQTLSEDQKLKAIEIALNDSVVHDKIGQIQHKYYSQEGWKFNMSNPVFYTVGNVTMGKVHEISLAGNKTRNLPSVELIFGHANLSDINLYAFVDLDKGRVAYIGYTGRSGPSAAGYYYTQADDGVVEHIENTGWLKEYHNLTITDAMYKADQQLSDAEKGRFLDTAMKNETVVDFLNEKASNGESCVNSYSVNLVEGDIAGHHYLIASPYLSISVKEPKEPYMSEYLLIKFDGLTNQIVSVDYITVPRPVPGPLPPFNMPPSNP